MDSLMVSLQSLQGWQAYALLLGLLVCSFDDAGHAASVRPGAVPSL